MVYRTRKPRKDPAQEELLRKKDILNERTSLLIQLLLNDKRGWNGRSAPDLGIPPSKITDPLPDEISNNAQKINQLADDIVARINDLVSSQREYAETKSNMSQRMAALEQLKKQASWPGSRLWSYITTPFRIGDKDRWRRLGLLRTSADLHEMLKEIDGEVLSQKPDDVVRAIQKTLRFTSILKNSFIIPITRELESNVEELKTKVNPVEEKTESRPLTSYIGRYVKKTFEFPDGNEELWVVITAVKGNNLVGKLDSDSQLNPSFKAGTEVVVSPDEIEEEFSRGAKLPREMKVLGPEDPGQDAYKMSEILSNYDRKIGRMLSYSEKFTDRAPRSIEQIRKAVLEFMAYRKAFGDAFTYSKPDMRIYFDKAQNQAQYIEQLYNQLMSQFDPKSMTQQAVRRVTESEVQKQEREGQQMFENLSNIKEEPPKELSEEELFAKEFADLNAELEELKKSQSENQMNELEKLASNRMTRWLARQRAKIFGGTTRGLTLDADKNINNTLKAVDGLMDVLEKPRVPGEEIVNGVQGVVRQAIPMLISVKELAFEHNRLFKEEALINKKVKFSRIEDDFRLITTAIRDLETFVTKLDQYKNLRGRG